MKARKINTCFYLGIHPFLCGLFKHCFKTLFISFHIVIWLFSQGFAQVEENIRPIQLSSEAPSLRFENLGIENGLAQASAHNIMQDSEGYIWISTQGGLHRYDGYEFKVFASTPFDTTSLSDSWVWTSAEAKNGDIWVTTENAGLNRMDRSSGKFTHYLHDPADSTSLSSNFTFNVLESSNGDLWVSTLGDGLNRMKADEDGKFSHFRYNSDDSTSITSDLLFYVSEDAEGNIWIGSANGINRIDPESETISRFLFDADVSRPGYGAPSNVLGQYHSTREPDIIWLATGNGLVRFNSKTGVHERFLIEPNSAGRINPNNFIHEVSPDPTHYGVLWVAGPGTGVARFDMNTGEFTSYRHDPRDPNSLPENFAQSIFTDHSGTMWVGHATEGLSVFNPGAVNFVHLRNNPEDVRSLAPGIIWGVYEDYTGTLWAGSDMGANGNYLTQFDPNTGNVIRHKHDPEDSETLLSGTLRVFAEDENRQFWVGGGAGLNRFHTETGKVTRFRRDNTEENLGRNSIFALYPTAKDSSKLWVGSAGGLDIFDTLTEEYSRIPFTAGNSGPGPVVVSLYEDHNNILWIGSNEGLFRFQEDTGITLISAYNPKDTTSISNNTIMSIVERAQEPGVLWLATQAGGLNRIDTHTRITTHYYTEHGLPSNTIYSVLEDNSGTLWMSTNAGISNFDPETNISRNYGLDDGLIALEYNQNAFFKGKSGVLYFGSGKGVTAFLPEQLHINEVPPKVVISGIKLFNKAIEVGPDSPLKKPIGETEKITLSHDQNEVTFDFVALHFANPEKNTYSYRLEGFEQDWVDAGTQRSATYTNLEPGTYTFSVKAANADGVWNNREASVEISILPPWYRTWMAYGFFAITIGFMVFGVDRLQRERLSKKEQARSALREAELRAEAENKRRSDTEQLSKIGQTITSTLSVDEIIETVYENVNALMDAAIFGVGIYNKPKSRLDFPATKEKGKMLPAYFYRLDENSRLAVWCFKNKKEIIIGDFANEYTKYVEEYKQPVEGDFSESIIYLPLIHQGQVIGVITTQSFKKNAYTEYHINLLRNLATYAAIALDNASAYRQLNATLSELKNMQNQLVQQEKLASLGQLTAGIAHEIKNPLNFVNNFSDLSAEMIQDARQEIETIRKYRNSPLPDGAFDEISDILNDIEINLNKIHDHGTRADNIVKSMLEHSRGGSGKTEYTDLNRLVREFTNLSYHGMRASKKPVNVDMQFTLDESLGKVPVIAEDISRVIINLCNNAFDAMREKLTGNGGPVTGYIPKLTVRTKSDKEKVTIEIEDNGPGIPEEIKDKILQPFFTTKKGTEGTGLGLSITNDIVKAHGGQLKIVSVPGKLTTFVISLSKHGAS